MKKESVEVALAQVKVKLGDKPANLAKAEEIIRNAHKKNTNLIVFPELYLQGYALKNMRDHFTLAESIPGLTSDFLVKLSAEYDIHIIMGMALENTILPGVIHNGVVFVGPKGLIGTYCKTHLATFPFPNAPAEVCAEGAYFSAGKELPVFDTLLGKIGICICYDIFFPEVTRILAVKGAEIIVCPFAADVVFKDFILESAMQCAKVNQVFFLSVNHIGVQAWPKCIFGGATLIIDPSGTELAKGREGEEDVVHGTLHLTKIRTTRSTIFTLRDRRPEIYRDLVR